LTNCSRSSGKVFRAMTFKSTA